MNFHPRMLENEFRKSLIEKFFPRTPLEAKAFGPSVYRGARLLYHENSPTPKLNETPEGGSNF